MRYKPFGSTGKDISVIGFGGMRFKEDDYKNGDYNKCAELVLRAQDLGINYFDTGPGYCNDKSETIYGHAFKQMKKLPYISTKCGLWHATDADGTRRRLEQSMKTLHVPHVDFYNMWCIKTMEDYRAYTKKGGVFDGMQRAKDDGLISHICCSTHADGDTIAEIVADGRVDAVTLGYNALNFAYRRTGIKACHAAGLGVVIMNPLGGGVIPQQKERFGFIKNSGDESIVLAALRFLLGQQEVNVALPGISSLSELEENVKAADKITPVTEEQLERMTKVLSEELDSLCTGCAYCDECPEGIPVPKLLDSFNQYILTNGSMDSVRSRMGMHWSVKGEKAKDCTGCGHCESLCTQKLPIIERLRMIAESV